MNPSSFKIWHTFYRKISDTFEDNDHSKIPLAPIDQFWYFDPWKLWAYFPTFFLIIFFLDSSFWSAVSPAHSQLLNSTNNYQSKLPIINLHFIFTNLNYHSHTLNISLNSHFSFLVISFKCNIKWTQLILLHLPILYTPLIAWNNNGLNIWW